MYRCQICNKNSESGQSQHRLVTETRNKQYFKEGKLVGEGRETVVEIAVCEECKTNNQVQEN